MDENKREVGSEKKKKKGWEKILETLFLDIYIVLQQVMKDGTELVLANPEFVTVL